MRDSHRFKKTKVIVNPAANHGETADKLAEIREFLEPRVAAYTSITTAPRHAVELARNLHDYDLVVVAGGDGTVFEVVNGLVASGNRHTTLGLIPTGSGNDLGRALGLPKEWRSAMERLLDGDVKTIDLGRVNDTYFTNSLAIGFDARVAHRTNQIKGGTSMSGLPLYLAALLDIVRYDYHCHRIRFKIDEGAWEKRDVLLVAINNGASYGGGFKITPEAVNNDGLLDVCLVDAVPRWEVLPRLPFVVAGRHAWMNPAHFYKVKSVRIESEKELPAALDGELILSKRFDVAVQPAALKVVAGR